MSVSLYYIHPQIPTRPFGPVETDESILIAELRLDRRPNLEIHAESYAPLLRPLTDDNTLGANAEAWALAFRKLGLALVKQSREESAH